MRRICKTSYHFSCLIELLLSHNPDVDGTIEVGDGLAQTPHLLALRDRVLFNHQEIKITLLGGATLGARTIEDHPQNAFTISG